MLKGKKNKRVLIFEVSCPSDVNVVAKENEKIKKCSGLRVELSKRWNSECDVIPVVVGGLGCVSKNFEVYLKRIPAELSKELCTRITTWERKTNEIFPIKKMTMMHLHPNLRTFCIDLCCHYGPNCLFKVGLKGAI